MDKKLIDSKTFCVIPWTSMCVLSHGDVKPCCISKHEVIAGNIKDSPLQDIWNDDMFKTLRLDMLNGVKNDICSICYDGEKDGSSSMRTMSNEGSTRYQDLVKNMNPDGSMKNLELEWLDVRLSSVCNFKCRTCQADTSSKWAEEDFKFGEYLPPHIISPRGFHLLETDTKYPLLPQIKEMLKTVKMIYFSGGEPLMHPEHYEILEYLIESKNTDVIIKYNSNLSVLKYKDKNVIDLWKQFKNVDYFASIDAIGEREEYIRHGAIWKEQVENLKTIQQQSPNVIVSFNVVVSLFNVITLPDTLDQMARIMGIDGPNSPHLHRLVTPTYFSVRVLDQETKIEAVKKLSDWIERNKFNTNTVLMREAVQEIIEYIKEDHTHMMPETKIHIDKIDSRRDENFVKTFPELERFYNLCGEASVK